MVDDRFNVPDSAMQAESLPTEIRNILQNILVPGFVAGDPPAGVVRAAAEAISRAGDHFYLEALAQFAAAFGVDDEAIRMAIELGVQDASAAPWVQPVRIQTKKIQRTSEGTIEAMLFELRRGLACLTDPANRERLKRCDKEAMTAIAERLLKPSWDYEGRYRMAGWQQKDVDRLIEMWGEL